MDWVPPQWNYEVLRLQLIAEKNGWITVKPPFRVGKSGVIHKFSYLAADGNVLCGFDFYENVRERDVQKVVSKRKDTGIYAIIVSLNGTPDEKIWRYADDRGVTILSPGTQVESFLRLCSNEIENPRAREPVR